VPRCADDTGFRLGARYRSPGRNDATFESCDLRPATCDLRPATCDLRPLTAGGQFDSYPTMSATTKAHTELEPGQFERIAKALSDPRRFAMLEAIGENRECPNQSLCSFFPVSKATISHHLRELLQAGLIEAERDGQFKSLRARPDVLRAYTEELLRRTGA
jgi:ArsR family transcriptional regulator